MSGQRKPAPRSASQGLPVSSWWKSGRFRVVAVGVATLLLVGLAVVWPGYDQQEAALDDGSIWVLQTGGGGSYGRINLDLGEIDTVKRLEHGSSLVQDAQSLLAFSDSGARFATVDLARPQELTADNAEAFSLSPDGTVQVASAGQTLAFRTESGSVYAGTAAQLRATGTLTKIEPGTSSGTVAGSNAGEGFVASALAVDEAGGVWAYSARTGQVLRAQADTGRVVGLEAGPPDLSAAQITAVNGRWVLFDPMSDRAYVFGLSGGVVVGAAGGLIQKSSASGNAVYFADSQGLVKWSLDSPQTERIVGGDGAQAINSSGPLLGTPAAPVAFEGEMLAAWVPDAGGRSGVLWSSAQAELKTLDFAGDAAGNSADPVFVQKGNRMVLNERRSGWVWTVPDGKLLPSSQQWQLPQQVSQAQDQVIPVDRIDDPRPPVAVDDSFGVRAGQVVSLPVLLNDYDPNEDVLILDQASVTGLAAGFGAAAVSNAEQDIVVQVSVDASGSAAFEYRLTDGTDGAGLFSESAQVQLRVVPDSVNTAPVWCGVTECQMPPPEFEVGPGGTVTFNALRGWVDPESDPIYAVEAALISGVGAVTVSPNGTLTYQHPDPNSTELSPALVALTVSDDRGATASQQITVEVTTSPTLTAQSFAQTAVVGEEIYIPLGTHITGEQGSVRAARVTAPENSAVQATVDQTGLGIRFLSQQSGTFSLAYTVADAVDETTAIARVTVHNADEPTVSLPPLTAFVRPGEDATVDVLAAAFNPAGLVLMVEGVVPQNAEFANLSVDLSGQQYLRVSGSTNSGEPGVLGTVTYMVSDGSENARSAASGQVTVILVRSPESDPPIAVDDRIVVRAGAQIDIPVLENDSAPSGALIALDPSNVLNVQGVGLAFAAGSALRYLAPQEPGEYALGYRIYRMGYPQATDSARVLVTVVAAEDNAAPTPNRLTGRVLSGESVRIPLGAQNADPDGDAVMIDRIVTQPGIGSAVVSAEGDAIIYNSVAGFSGQVWFEYQVRDDYGATGSAQVQVGVLHAEANPRPVTYSDYVQVQAGEGSEAIISPTENDLDPAGQELTLVSVVPHAPADSAEYDALSQMLAGLDQGRVRIRAGETLGTFSFVYTVQNTSGDTATGFIVVKVVRDPVPDYPIISDTVLTLENQDLFPSGVDVLSGKVSWTGGDIAGLTVSLWADPAGVRMIGNRISGELTERTQLIPFEVSGAAFDGTEVTSYGFLRVLGSDQARISLKSGTPPVQVREGDLVDLDIATMLAVPPGSSLQIGEGVRAGGARPAATCALVSGTVLRYTAGSGAPWTDTCLVPVRTAAQSEFTTIVIRVQIEPEIPQPILRAAASTVSPGQSTTYDLSQMVSWAGKEDWARLGYVVSYSGDQFIVSQQGPLLSITARDSARPGRQESVSVHLSSHPETPAAGLILTVGPAPSSLPKGGSVSQVCSQVEGNLSCNIRVIGVGAEVNPLPGTPLQVVNVADPAGCPGVAFSVLDSTTVQANWRSDAPGAAACTADFTVEDAQGRRSSGVRNGQLMLDLRGLPAAPTRLEWVAYSPETVTLRPVSDSGSYPAVTGYQIFAEGEAVATCSATGECPPISVPMEQPQSFTAVALNTVGQSRAQSSAVKAWSYRTPLPPTEIQSVPLPTSDGSGGVVQLDISGLDPSTGALRISGGGEGEKTVTVTGQQHLLVDYRLGTNNPTRLTITPVTRFPMPPIDGPGSSVGHSAEVTAQGLGNPKISLDVTASTGSNLGSVSAAVKLDPALLPPGSTVLVGLVLEDSCIPVTAIAPGEAYERVFSGLNLWETVQVLACAQAQFGGENFGLAELSQSAQPVTEIPAPTGIAKYRVLEPYLQEGENFFWEGPIEAPQLGGPAGFEVMYRTGSGNATANFVNLFQVGVKPGAITAQLCRAQQCGPEVAVTASGAAYQARAVFPGSCAVGGPPPVPQVWANSADYSWSVLDSADESNADGSGGEVRTLEYGLVWHGDLAGLEPVTQYRLTCSGAVGG